MRFTNRETGLEVDARKWDGENYEQMRVFVHPRRLSAVVGGELKIGFDDVKASPGNYVIIDHESRLSVHKEEDFLRTHKPVIEEK